MICISQTNVAVCVNTGIVILILNIISIAILQHSMDYRIDPETKCVVSYRLLIGANYKITIVHSKAAVSLMQTVTVVTRSSSEKVSSSVSNKATSKSITTSKSENGLPIDSSKKEFYHGHHWRIVTRWNIRYVVRSRLTEMKTNIEDDHQQRTPHPTLLAYSSQMTVLLLNLLQYKVLFQHQLSG